MTAGVVGPAQAVRGASARALDASRRVVGGLAAHDGFRSAAAVAFWLFLSLVPLLVLVGFLVGLVARHRGVDALAGPLLQVVPTTAEDIVRVEIERLAGSGASLAPLGALGFLWSASSGIHNLLDVFDRAAGVSRPYLVKRVVAFAWVLIGLVSTCLVAWLLVRLDVALRPHESALSRAAAAVGSAVPPLRSAEHALNHAHNAVSTLRTHARAPRPALESFLAATVTLVAGIVGLSFFYRYAVVHTGGRGSRVLPGTLAAVGCWLVLSWAFGVYAAQIANYALFYGSLAAVAVLLIWLYLTTLCLMVGVEVNALLEHRPRTSRAPLPSVLDRRPDRARARGT